MSLTSADRANGQANPAGADILDEHVFSVLAIGLDRERVVLVPDVAVVPVVFGIRGGGGGRQAPGGATGRDERATQRTACDRARQVRCTGVSRGYRNQK